MIVAVCIALLAALAWLSYALTRARSRVLQHMQFHARPVRADDLVYARAVSNQILAYLVLSALEQGSCRKRGRAEIVVGSWVEPKRVYRLTSVGEAAARAIRDAASY